MNYVIEYANQIESGEIITSKRVAKIYADLKERILNPQRQYIFSKEKANYSIEFIERFCKHSKGQWAGKAVELELFQKAYISALFGFVDRDTGLRQYKESLFMVGRKNGKSTMLAGIALYMLIADGEAGSEVYSVATKKDQAKLVFDATLEMVQQSNDLSNVIRKRKTDLYHSQSFSKFQPLGANSDTLDGLNSHLVIIDELHAVKDRNLYEVMKQSVSSREQPLIVMITTAGTVRENIFDDIYNYACNVVDGVYQDDTFLSVIYELDNREEYKDPEMWVKANPGLGTIKKISYIEEQLNRAGNNPVDLRGILVKDFNIRENASGTWLSFEQILNTATFDITDFKNHFVIGGADLSKTGDLTSATLLTMDKYTEQKYALQMYWIPEDSLMNRTEEERQIYQKWIDLGLMRICEGNSISYSDITQWFIQTVQENQLKVAWVYYDAWSAKYWVEEMEGYGFDMREARQGYKTLSLPMQILGADLEANRVNYNNNPILKWCLSNTAVKSDVNGNIQPIKNSAPAKRIDGTVSLLNAYVGLQENYIEFKEAQPNKL
ncbi:terminase large subunit [Aerococcaceae bacterium WGS1372]